MIINDKLTFFEKYTNIVKYCSDYMEKRKIYNEKYNKVMNVLNNYKYNDVKLSFNEKNWYHHNYISYYNPFLIKKSCGSIDENIVGIYLIYWKKTNHYFILKSTGGIMNYFKLLNEKIIFNEPLIDKVYNNGLDMQIYPVEYIHNINYDTIFMKNIEIENKIQKIKKYMRYNVNAFIQNRHHILNYTYTQHQINYFAQCKEKYNVLLYCIISLMSSKFITNLMITVNSLKYNKFESFIKRNDVYNETYTLDWTYQNRLDKGLPKETKQCKKIKYNIDTYKEIIYKENDKIIKKIKKTNNNIIKDKKPTNKKGRKKKVGIKIDTSIYSDIIIEEECLNNIICKYKEVENIIDTTVSYDKHLKNNIDPFKKNKALLNNRKRRKVTLKVDTSICSDINIEEYLKEGNTDICILKQNEKSIMKTNNYELISNSDSYYDEVEKYMKDNMDICNKKRGRKKKPTIYIKT